MSDIAECRVHREAGDFDGSCTGCRAQAVQSKALYRRYQRNLQRVIVALKAKL